MNGTGQGDGGRSGEFDRDGDRWSDLPPVAGLVVPDDPRDLEEDVRAWRREMADRARDQLREQRRRRRTGASPGRLRRLGLSAPLVLSTVAAVALVGLFTIVLGPRASRVPAVPLATGVGETGQVGALLPDVTLTAGSGIPVSTRFLRPAVVVLVPRTCDAGCTTLVGDVVAQARSLQVQSAVVVTSTGSGAGVGDLVGATPGATVLTDSTGLGRELDATGVTAVVVGADGVVVDIVRSVSDGDRLEPRIRPISPAE